MTLVEFLLVAAAANGGRPDLNPADEVLEITSLPRADDFGLSVKHLPDDIERFFETAQRALLAGIPDAAAVQLRKTLEAAAAKKGIEERNLYKAVQKLLAENYLTQDFAGLLDHVRKIGNIGAHYNDTILTAAEVERSLRFTTQVLRNLFEVPGELAELEAAGEAAEQASADGSQPDETSTLVL